MDVTPDLYINNLSFTHIQKSPVHGYGLFASQDLTPSTCLGELDGQIISWHLFDTLANNTKHLHLNFQQYFFMEWNCLNENTLLARPFRTRYSLINHSRSPNLEIAYKPLRIMVIKPIKANEELFLDYRKEPLPLNYLQDSHNSFL